MEGERKAFSEQAQHAPRRASRPHESFRNGLEEIYRHGAGFQISIVPGAQTKAEAKKWRHI